MQKKIKRDIKMQKECKNNKRGMVKGNAKQMQQK